METVDGPVMKAARIHQFGGPEVIAFEEVARPLVGQGQVLVRVRAAGVGPWDAWVRAGKSVIAHSLPLTLGSDLSGNVVEVGEGVADFQAGDEVFGLTNAEFTGAYAEYAVAEAGMIAAKPRHLSHLEAASVPVVASTAWQMVFDYGQVEAGKRVLVHGAAGNVGAYAVQLAKRAGAEVITTAFPRDLEYVRNLGADEVIDARAERFEAEVKNIDVVLDTVGAESQERSFEILRPGGILVSSVSPPDQRKSEQCQIKGVFFLVAVTTQGLTQIANLFDRNQLVTDVGEVLPLAEARRAHEMLAGQPHKRGKIVLFAAENSTAP